LSGKAAPVRISRYSAANRQLRELFHLIASFTHKFIFLKTRKVGGTSLEIVLSSWCAGRDICTRVPPADEAIRTTYGGQARNFRRADGSVRFFNHMPATEVRRELPKFWAAAFKFTVDRHPYEKVVSRAWWNIGRRGGSPEAELADEIELAVRNKSYLNFPIYTADGELLVDELWRYDDMWPRLDSLADRLGLPAPAQPPRAKAQHRKDPRPARDVLTEDQRAQIYEDARLEFDLLGFEP
jgi:hypothetical protein